MLDTIKITVTLAGADGSATGATTSSDVILGELVGIYLDYTSEPATCDITITTASTPARTLLTVTDNATDGWYYVAHTLVSAANTTISDGHRPFYLGDKITVSAAQGNAGSVIAYIQVWS